MSPVFAGVDLGATDIEARAVKILKRRLNHLVTGVLKALPSGNFGPRGVEPRAIGAIDDVVGDPCRGSCRPWSKRRWEARAK